MAKQLKLLMPYFDYLNNTYSYDRLSGKFFFKEDKSRSRTWRTLYEGKEAGNLNSGGYVRLSVKLNGVATQIYAHRLAWLLHYKEEPPELIDHKDEVRHHNWILNLRKGTEQSNRINTSKTKGILVVPEGFQYRVTLEGKDFLSPVFTLEYDAVIERKRFVEGLCKQADNSSYKISIDDLRDIPGVDVILRTPTAMIAWLESMSYTGSTLFMDSDLGDPHTEGRDILDMIISEGQRPFKVVLVTSNPVSREYMAQVLVNNGYLANLNGIEFDLKF